MEKLYGHKAFYLGNYTVNVGPNFGGFRDKPLRLRKTIFGFFNCLCNSFATRATKLILDRDMTNILYIYIYIYI